MKYLIIICGMIGIALLYLLSSASENSSLFSHHYSSLLALTGVLALGLGALVSYQLWQLRIQLKQQVFGAKLMLRLTLFFSLIAILPGILMYAVSVQFLGKSIESWFDIRVEKALEGGLNLGRNSLEAGLKDLGKKAKFISLILADQTPDRYGATLKRLVDKNEAQEAAIFNPLGKMIASSIADNKPPQNLPDRKMIQEAGKNGIYSLVDALPSNQLILRVLVPINTEQNSGGRRFLQFVQPVSMQFATDAETVQSVYRDYQELTLSRLGLKRLYGITLTLSLLIVLLSAVSAAFFLSGRLTSPLAALAEGTRAVAQGNFSGNYPVQSRDELGALTGLFNQMTAQLADAKKLGEQQQTQVENAKGYLESILTHLSSGVIVVDEQFNLRLVNASAEQILGVPLRMRLGITLVELAAEYILVNSFVEAVLGAPAAMSGNEWQKQIERLSRNGQQVLLLRCTRLSTAMEKGLVIVFDDITHLLQAERQAAWGEVARRLAHEIKNPLTPIQLSAERLQHKLNSKLDEQDAKLLQRATQTIVSQVAAMKNMVNDFADYARAPTPKLTLLNMHQLLIEVMGLYEANTSPIDVQLGASRMWINGDATRLRQVVHNLLQNAHDALAQTKKPQIVLSTASTHSEFHLMVSDNGTGIQEDIFARIFEPYMTTKAKGTGLGLPIVKKIIEEHGGRISIENNISGGTRVIVSLPLALEMEVA
ncbi:MAG: ATP-binding protein [Gallionellaceae bacterium]|jgi:nitrogen fixation/metabolism regulation signal transduction histidine kinase